MGELTPPIVVAGMHRSGTALVVDLLQNSGCFFGARLDPNQEDFFFLLRNEWLMRRAGGAWDHPLPLLSFLSQPECFDSSLDFLRRHVRSPRFSRFTGYLAYFSGKWGRGAVRPWGFKDPRNTFTFPLWRRVFPGARLIYVRRNGVDVAESLRNRSLHQLRSIGKRPGILSLESLPRRLARAVSSFESFDHQLHSSRCFSLQESFRLWEEYVEQGERLFEEYQGPKLALRFEELVTNTGEVFAQLASFCGLSGDQSPRADLIARVRPERARAFLARDDLREFYRSVQQTRWMRRLGYDALA